MSLGHLLDRAGEALHCLGVLLGADVTVAASLAEPEEQGVEQLGRSSVRWPTVGWPGWPSRRCAGVWGVSGFWVVSGSMVRALLRSGRAHPGLPLGDPRHAAGVGPGDDVQPGILDVFAAHRRVAVTGGGQQERAAEREQ